jgi:4-amino-4-deoxy-L-arabinose transferase-like glycosyltransferase
VIVVAAMFSAAVSIAIAFGSAPLQTPDETAHLDYAVQLWHGRLPVFGHGLAIAPSFGAIPPVQWVSQHPPLFYAILAPVVGPLWDGGHQYLAVLAGRSVNAVLAGLTVVAIAWAAGRIVPGRPRVAAIAAIVSAPTGMLVLVGGAVYNDLPNVALGALALGIGATALRRGLSTATVIGAVLVAACGMLSRLSFGVFLVALLVALVLAPWLRRGSGGRFWSGLGGHATAVAATIVAPLASAGWFFLRNERLTGNLSGSHPKWAEDHLHRTTFSLGDVAGSGSFWSTSLSLYRGHLDAGSPEQWVLLGVPLLLAVAVLVVLLVRRRGRWSWPGALVVAMLVGVAVLVAAAQVDYRMGGGGVNSRYFLPMLPVLVVPMAIGLAAFGRVVSTVLTGLWTAVAAYVCLLIPDLATALGPDPAAVDVARIAVAASIVLGAGALALLAFVPSGRLAGCRSAN